jgi:hypothetical protein
MTVQACHLTACIIDNPKSYVMAKSTKKKMTDKPLSDEEAKLIQAHRDADEDIREDPEMDMDEERGDDLDEGELARLDNSNDDE